MKGTILLDYDEDVKKVEAEEQNRFIHSILEEVGLNLSGVWKDPTHISIDEKIKLRSLLQKNGIDIINDNDGGITIVANSKPIAIWKKCLYKIKKDLSQVNPKKRLYLEMTIDIWSLFEEKTK